MTETPDQREDPGEPGGTTWNAPNQQVVREDQSGPADVGDGGGATQEEPQATPVSLDDMTKDELLALAEQESVEVPAGATKAEIREALGR